MKKHYLLLFVFLTLGFFVSAQKNLKEMVGIVRPIYPEATVDFLKDFGKSLRSRGYVEASEVMESYTKGGFGTGFVIKSESGKYYMITNKHVVQSAKYVTVEFLNKRDTIRYKECKVKVIDDWLDLALLELPKSAKFNNVLTISKQSVSDGTDVFTAGFPGLGSKPSWQLGKGIVSNSEVYDESFTNHKNSYVIQHTAQVDPGSSGGPLLVKSKSNPNKYEVVGVNTWKAMGRENANFSIPAEILSKFISDNLNKSESLNKEDLQKQIEAFVKTSSKDYKAVIPYIGYSYISNISVNNFYDLLNSLPDDIQEDVKKDFVSGMPIDGVRTALASAVYNRLKQKEIKIKGIKKISPNNKEATVNISEKGSTVETKWVAEQGNWKLAYMPSIKTNELGKNGIATDLGYRGSFFLLADFPFFKRLEKSYILAYSNTYKTFLVYRFGFGRTFVKTVEQEYDYATNTYYINPIKHKGITVQGSVGVQMPVRLSPVYIIPNARLLAGTTMVKNDLYSTIYMGYSFGVQTAYKIHTNMYLMAGLEFKSKRYNLDYKEFVPVINLGITF